MGRLSKERFAKVLTLLKNGKSAEEITKETGVLTPTVHTIAAKFHAKKEQPVEGVKIADVMGKDRPGDAGIDAARKAAGPIPGSPADAGPGAGTGAPASAGSAPGGGSSAGSVPGGPGTAAFNAGEALVVTCEGIAVTVCRIQAVRLKVRITPKLVASWKFTQGEKDSLRMFSDYAAPYVMKLLQNFDKVAAGVFAIVFAGLLSDRFAVLKELAPKKAEKVPPPPVVVPSPAASAPAPMEPGPIAAGAMAASA